MNTINLAKGQFIDLSKTNPFLKKLRLGLKWGANRYAGPEADLDCSVFCTNVRDTIPADKYLNFVFYNNLNTPCSGVVHAGDNKTGGSAKDDESIFIDLEKISPDIHNIHFVVTIHNAQQNRQNFGQIESSVVNIYDTETDNLLCKFDLGTDFSTETALLVATLSRKGGNDWGFRAVGQGYTKGLDHFVKQFGLSV